MNRPELYPFESVNPPPVEPSNRERVMQATADLSTTAGTAIDGVVAGVQVVAESGEAVSAGCDLCGMVVEGVMGLIGGLLG